MAMRRPFGMHGGTVREGGGEGARVTSEVGGLCNQDIETEQARQTLKRANARQDRDRPRHLRSSPNCARLRQSKSKKVSCAHRSRSPRERVGDAATQKPQALAQFSFMKTGSPCAHMRAAFQPEHSILSTQGTVVGVGVGGFRRRRHRHH